MSSVPSSFDALLDTDFIPHQDDVQSIKAIIEKQKVELASLEEEMRPIEALYNDFVARKKQLANSLTAHRGLISTTRRHQIPDDILREIFMRCLPRRGDVCISQHEAPLLLTQICSNWRRVVLSTPRLWASIQIHLTDEPVHHVLIDPRPSEDDIRRRMEVKKEALQTWLKRSMACPLSITAFGQLMVSPGASHDLFDLLVSESKRWEKIYFSLSPDRVQRLSHLKPDDLQALVSVDLHIEQPGPFLIPGQNIQIPSWDSAPLSASPLISAPNIRHFNLRAFAGHVQLLPVNWANLVTLKLISNEHPKTIPEIVDLLKQCQRLVSFIIAIHSFGNFNDPFLQIQIGQGLNPVAGAGAPAAPPPEEVVVNRNAEVITLPYLTSLEITISSPTQSSSSFRELRMPAITKFKYTSPPDTDPSARSPILEMAQAYTLRSLAISSLSLKTEPLVECLRSCSELVQLTILRAAYAPPQTSDATTFNDFLETISVPDEEGNFICPKLEVFQHTGLVSGTLSWSDEDILQFLKRKQAGTQGLAKLKVFVVNFGRCQEKPLRDDFKPFQDDGLKIFLRYIVKSHMRAPRMTSHTGDAGFTFSTDGFDLLDTRLHHELF